jgi:magnesium chelatase family protein
MNPCKCGFFGSDKTCTCSAASRKQYLDRISGPLLDRIDMEIELPAVSYDEISGKTEPGEPSKNIRERVNFAREFSRNRLKKMGIEAPILNANVSGELLHKTCAPDEEGEKLMRDAFEALGLSARGHDRVLRVARTIADLEGSETIGADHIAEAIMYRSLDRKYWRK